jgi:hypothetical protein
MSSTSSALLSTHSSSVQETASQTVSSTHNQAQIPGPQNEAHTSDPENQAVISDPVGVHNPGKVCVLLPLFLLYLTSYGFGVFGSLFIFSVLLFFLCVNK